MAIIPSNEYAAQVSSGDAGWPLGKAKNVVVSGDGTGTPLDAEWLNDLWGFLQAVLAEAGATASGNPDQVGASQYLDAIKGLNMTTKPRSIFRLTTGFSTDWSVRHGPAITSVNYTTNNAEPQFASLPWAVTGTEVVMVSNAGSSTVDNARIMSGFIDGSGQLKLSASRLLVGPGTIEELDLSANTVTFAVAVYGDAP